MRNTFHIKVTLLADSWNHCPYWPTLMARTAQNSSMAVFPALFYRDYLWRSVDDDLSPTTVCAFLYYYSIESQTKRIFKLIIDTIDGSSHHR